MFPTKTRSNFTASNSTTSNALTKSARGWQTHFGLAVVILSATTIFFLQLGACQLWDRDEPRNAGCAAEMMQRGDWVVPIFNDELRYQKPVMLYWLMMSAYRLFGVNEWSARFWSALLSVGTVALTYGIARRLFDQTTATLSGLALTSSVMFVVASRAATPDAALIFFSTATLFSFVMGATRDKHSHQLHRSKVSEASTTNLAPTVDFKHLGTRWLLLVGIGMGLAILTKGPIGLLMPMAIIGMYLLLMRQAFFLPTTAHTMQPPGFLADTTTFLLTVTKAFHPVHFFKTTLAMRPLLLGLVALAIALPWYVWVGVRTEGDFLRIFFLTEHLGRSTTAFENHSGGVWYYPVAILFGFFPWSLFWLPVALILQRLARDARSGNRSFVCTHPGLVLMMCWVGVQVSLFTLARTKLPSYITPCYPGLAILTSACLVQWMRQPRLLARWWMPAAFVTTLLTGGAIALGLWVAGERYLESVQLAAIGIPIVAAGALGLLLQLRNRSRQAIANFTVCAALFALALFGYGTGQIAALQNNQKILSHVRKLPAHIKVASFGCLESSWVFYAGRPVYELERQPSASANEPVARKFWQPKPRPGVRQFVLRNPDAPLITTVDDLPELQQQLPEGYQVVAQADYFMKNKKLLLIKRPR